MKSIVKKIDLYACGMILLILKTGIYMSEYIKNK